jgi:hypothetical protein
MPRSKIAIPVSDEVARQLPASPEERQEVLVLGIREWRVRKALDVYARGEGSLAFAARQAGVSLREIIPLAYAHGLSPKVDPTELEDLQAVLSTR